MSTLETLKVFVDDSWLDVKNAHERLTFERTEDAADEYTLALARWREAVRLYDTEVVTRLRLTARLQYDAARTSSTGGPR